MRSEYEKLIKEHDKTINSLRRLTQRCRGAEQAEFQKQLDDALDNRLRLMKLRDAELTTGKS